MQFAETILDVGTGVFSRFLHLTFRKYLAALHLAKLPLGTQTDISQVHCKSPHLTVVCRFFFGTGFRKLQNSTAFWIRMC